MNPFTEAKIIGSNVSNDDYRKQDKERGDPAYVMSRSELMTFSECPARWRRGYVRPQSKALSNGSLVDTLLLTPDRFQEVYVECPQTYESLGMKCPSCLTVTDSKTCRACKCDREPFRVLKPWDTKSKTCQEWIEAHPNLIPVKFDHMQETGKAVAAIREDELLADMLDSAQKQVWVAGAYKDRHSGLVIPVKSLLDIVPAQNGPYGKWLWDFKTCRSASTHTSQRECFAYGYAAQAAMHSDLYIAATNEDRSNFAHLLQESIDPFHFERDLLSVEFVELGRMQIMSALALYCRCLSTNRWPGYPAQTIIEGFRLLQPEAWMVTVDQHSNAFAEEDPEETPETEQNDFTP